ncbi:tRNA dihydrouridine synthase DusB [Kangiella sediminilitoris]|uniref:tRNA-dihydrouridine synthase B n=1 Tax=Kangiella sediminilitoris TaxID=1144748 RepID=A0A1B3BDE4_9GAMM|nr:tRNA dihydrouridine synthase DusB [Kangiella sediminilitoris]AOE50849.1 tRNA-dihydrouridine synthase B [Kangiella sediminilitoris]
MQIAQYQLDNPLILAPMAGVTDRPFRLLCKELGAGMTVSEMIASNPKLWNTKKSLMRSDHRGEPGIRSVQIAGAEPEMMALAAQHNVENGAEIIDINMGCPAKKVCKKAAGSALLQYPDLVEDIVKAVVGAVDVPVTLKIRTGWNPDNRNGVEIAKIAEANGIQALAVHGRTRACKYQGYAEYDTIAAIKQAISIPLIANGDITSPQKAKYVLEHTGADALMIGRGAQGNPWIFREIWHYLQTGEILEPPTIDEVQDVMIRHVKGLHQFYGDHMGPKIARKHVSWYLQEQADGKTFRSTFNRIDDGAEQIDVLNRYFEQKQQAIAA